MRALTEGYRDSLNAFRKSAVTELTHTLCRLGLRPSRSDGWSRVR